MFILASFLQYNDNGLPRFALKGADLDAIMKKRRNEYHFFHNILFALPSVFLILSAFGKCESWTVQSSSKGATPLATLILFFHHKDNLPEGASRQWRFFVVSKIAVLHISEYQKPACMQRGL